MFEIFFKLSHLIPIHSRLYNHQSLLACCLFNSSCVDNFAAMQLGLPQTKVASLQRVTNLLAYGKAAGLDTCYSPVTA